MERKLHDEDFSYRNSVCIDSKEIEEYLNWEKEKGTSLLTVRKLRRFLEDLMQFVKDESELTTELLGQWKASLIEKGYSSVTVGNYVKGVNRYLDYAGASQLKFPRGKAKDLAGKMIGYLKVLHPAGKEERNNVLWQCECRCGKLIEVPATRLLMGNTLSCGCLRTEQLQRANKNIEKTNLSQALKDTSQSAHSMSGYVGVTRKKEKWQAYINYKGKRYSLGCYDKLEDAVEARKRAKEKVMEDAEVLLEEYERRHRNDQKLPKTGNKLQLNHKTSEKSEETLRSNNVSGVTGVSLTRNRWEARITVQGITYRLGVFEDKQKAVEARRNAEKMLKSDPTYFADMHQK